MRVLFVNNDGGGFANYVEVEDNTTVDKFFQKQIHDGQPGDYLIRVNRQPAPRDYILKEGDRVTMTPVKIEGARVPIPRIAAWWSVSPTRASVRDT